MSLLCFFSSSLIIATEFFTLMASSSRFFIATKTGKTISCTIYFTSVILINSPYFDVIDRDFVAIVYSKTVFDGFNIAWSLFSMKFTLFCWTLFEISVTTAFTFERFYFYSSLCSASFSSITTGCLKSRNSFPSGISSSCS